jgi:hypothetical protein
MAVFVRILQGARPSSAPYPVKEFRIGKSDNDQWMFAGSYDKISTYSGQFLNRVSLI